MVLLKSHQLNISTRSVQSILDEDLYQIMIQIYLVKKLKPNLNLCTPKQNGSCR